MSFVLWITRGTDTHLEYVIRVLIFTATVVSRTRLSVTFIPTLFLVSD